MRLIEVEVVVRLGLVDVAGAAAGDRLQLDELEADLGGERLRRGVELFDRQQREAALVVGDGQESDPALARRQRRRRNHFSAPYGSRSSSPLSCTNWRTSDSARAPPFLCFTRSKSARDTPPTVVPRTCGGTGSGPSSVFHRDLLLQGLRDTLVLGRASVQNLQPVVFAEVRFLACRAPSVESIPSTYTCCAELCDRFAGSTLGNARSRSRALQMPCSSEVYDWRRSTVALVARVAHKGIPFASAAGPRKSRVQLHRVHSSSSRR